MTFFVNKIREVIFMYEKLLEAINQNIINILDRKNISSRKLSKIIGKNDGYISRMLNGKFVPSLEVLCLIADKLGTTVSDLTKI